MAAKKGKILKKSKAAAPAKTKANKSGQKMKRGEAKGMGKKH